MTRIILSFVFTLFLSPLYAQQGAEDISGVWQTGKHNTLIEIDTGKAPIMGTVVSTDAPDGEVGKVIVSEFEENEGSWRVTIYSPERDKHYPAEIYAKADVLHIKVKVGFFSREIEWLRHTK